MRRLITTAAALATITAIPASDVQGQSSLLNLGVDYTAAFTGDDFDALEGGFGFKGGILFQLGPMAHIGGEIGWTNIDFESPVADENIDASLMDFMGVLDLSFSDSPRAQPYLDLRAGYSRMSFEFAATDGSIDGPTAGAGFGVRFRPGGVWIDVHGRYQQHWFGEFEGAVFEEDSSGGRFALAAGVSIPLGGS